MGILDKLMFWKKKEELGELEPVEKAPKFGEEMFGGETAFREPQYRPPEEFETKPSAPPAGPMPEYADMASKNFEIVSAKLDAIRASLESISQRIANIEKSAEESRKKSW